MSAAVEQAAAEERPEKKTGYLELFFDLVYVYAITQVTQLVIGDLTPAGFARALLLLGMIWWAWSAYAWMTNAIDLSSTFVRLLLLVGMGASFFMAYAVPDAFGGAGLWFALPLFVVRMIWFVLYVNGLEPGSPARAAVMHTSPYFMLAPVLIVAGGALEGDQRVAVWVLAMAIDLYGSIRAGREDWQVSPSHFTERYQLLIIICLGESIVAIGVGASGAHRDAALAVSAAFAFVGAATLWWAYFDWISAAIERRMVRAVPAERGRLARDVFTYYHFPIATGIILYAVAAKLTVGHSGDELAGGGRFALAAGITFTGLGIGLIRWRLVHRLAYERMLAGGAICVLAIAGGGLPAGVLLGLSVTILSGAIAFESWRLREWRNAFERG